MPFYNFIRIVFFYSKKWKVIAIGALLLHFYIIFIFSCTQLKYKSRAYNGIIKDTTNTAKQELHATILSDASELSKTPKKNEKFKVRYGRIIVPLANIRKGPDITFDIWDQVRSGNIFILKEKIKNWWIIEDPYMPKIVEMDMPSYYIYADLIDTSVAVFTSPVNEFKFIIENYNRVNKLDYKCVFKDGLDVGISVENSWFSWIYLSLSEKKATAFLWYGVWLNCISRYGYLNKNINFFIYKWTNENDRIYFNDEYLMKVTVEKDLFGNLEVIIYRKK